MRSFGSTVSGGIGVGYLGAFGHTDADEPKDAFTAEIRFNYRINNNAKLDAGQDFAGRSHVGYRYQEGSGVGSWNTQLDLDHTGALGQGDGKDYGVNGAFGYIGNRAELSVSHHTGLAGLDTDELDQRTALTAGTALAFADGSFAIGRPVSNGFAIVAPYDNLPDSDVVIGASQEANRGSSGIFGPALVSEMSAYAPARVDYSVDNLPVGYDLGAGTFDLLPAYKSGYRLTIGSDYTVTAFGTVLDDKGEPIALLTGTAQEEGRTDGPKVEIFTNRTGRFGAQGLRPGRWTLEMATEPKTRFVIDIPKDAVGLVKLDTLRPAERTQ